MNFDVDAALERIHNAEDEQALERVRIELLGRSGELTQQLRGISQLPQDPRAASGQRLNRAKQQLEEALQQRRTELQQQQLQQEQAETVDLTRPGIGTGRGRLHPVAQLQSQLVQIFQRLGFEVADGPEVETDWYCFEALNIGPHHPARDMQDTFYLENGAIPRTHTSSVQIRHMEQSQPPIRIIAPGKVYRNEDEDATHLWAFHQLECLVVDEGISLSDLKGTIEYMLKQLFGEQTQLKLLPNYFPYTEPSMEMHASCMMCREDNGGSCRVCKDTDWVELGGAGMVHPNVLRNVGIDPSVYSGFAFGFGLERIATIKHEIPDLRDFWRPNLRFLEQF